MIGALRAPWPHHISRPEHLPDGGAWIAVHAGVDEHEFGLSARCSNIGIRISRQCKWD
jgi:hypothetical protein